MKTVKFKKWIITAIASFIFSIILLGITIVVSGSNFVHTMTESNFSWDSNLTHNIDRSFATDSEPIQSYDQF